MAWTLIQCLRIEVKLKVSLARHEKAGSRAEAGVARLEGHSLKHREVLQLITVNRYGMVWYGVVLLDPIGSLYIGNIEIEYSKPPLTKIAVYFHILGHPKPIISPRSNLVIQNEQKEQTDICP